MQSQQQGDRINHAQDRSRFEALYSECFRGVYGYIFARVQDTQTAEDITSETFFKAWRRWPPRTITGAVPKAWLFRIAQNLVVDHYRTANRRQIVPLNEEGVCNPQDNPGADCNLNVLAVRMALFSLSLRDQDVLSLRLAGQSNREIGSVLKIGEAAAGMACLRALRRLKEKLGE